MNKELLEKLLAMYLDEKPETQRQEKQMIGDFVIVRCRDAGVHAGTLVSYEGREVVMKDSRRLWYWVAGGKSHSLSGVAEYGLADGSKIPPPVKNLVLPEACEIIATTTAAEKSIKEYPIHEVH